MQDKAYFSHLYQIARHLNQEFSLQAALRKALEKTVNLLELETGWIWLVQPDNQSVYLAASYQLPPALSKHPERLSGWCTCIERYLSDAVSQATNISEITCSRLKDIQSETRDLKFHATVPIFVEGEKMGLLNLLSKETQQLSEQQLTLLNTISELIGIAIQRTRLQESFRLPTSDGTERIRDILIRVIQPRLDTLFANLSSLSQQVDGQAKLQQSLELAAEMQEQLALITQEVATHPASKPSHKEFHYPSSPLTKRELEVLTLVKKGFTNKQIAEQLFITERTVKFHISSILSKLYAETRTEAVDTALRRGLLGL